MAGCDQYGAYGGVKKLHCAEYRQYLHQWHRGDPPRTQHHRYYEFGNRVDTGRRRQCKEGKDADRVDVGSTQLLPIVRELGEPWQQGPIDRRAQLAGGKIRQLIRNVVQPQRRGALCAPDDEIGQPFLQEDENVGHQQPLREGEEAHGTGDREARPEWMSEIADEGTRELRGEHARDQGPVAAQPERQWYRNGESRQLAADLKRELPAKPELLAKSNHADVLATADQRAERQPAHHPKKRGLAVEARDRPGCREHQQEDEEADQNVARPRGVIVPIVRCLVLDQSDVEA